ncbi:MAG: glycosyltransferase family 39 protein [Anaerolineae bacterium]
MTNITEFIQRHLLRLMLVLQLAWLLGAWLTGAAPQPDKLIALAIYSLLAAIVVENWPSAASAWLGPWAERLRHEKNFLLLLVAGVLVTAVFYARVQHVWPFDEEYSFKAATLVAQGGVRALLQGYSQLPWLGTQHPPLMMILYGGALRLLGGDLLAMRLVAVLFGVGLVCLTYLIGRELFDEPVGRLAALSLLTFPLILRQAAAAMTDVPVTFFFSLVIWLMLRLRKRPSYRLTFLTALVIGIGVLTKYTMVFIYPVLLGFLIVSPQIRQRARYWLILILLPTLPVLLWVVYAYWAGILWSQITTLASYAALMATNDLVRRFALETFVTRLPSALGPYNLPLFVVGGWLVYRRRREADRLLLVWIGVVWLLLTVTLPDHRYFMLSFPALAVVMAQGLQGLTAQKERGN